MISLDRIKLERVILGSCLLENSYPKVADILSPRNFSRPNISIGHFADHQEIYRVFENFYPLKPIDVVTVAHQFRKSLSMAVYIAELSASVTNSAHIRSHALLLMESNIRSDFAELLQSKVVSGQFNNTTVSVLQEIIKEANDSDNDIFDVIDKSVSYLNRMLVDVTIIKSIQDLSGKMSARIQATKRLASIDCLLKNLMAISQIPHDATAQISLHHLSEIIKSIIATGKITDQAAKQIYGISIH